MKKFTEFTELQETLNNPYPAVLKKDGRQGYRSTVELDDGGKLNINIEGDEHIDDDDYIDWEISFERNGEQKVTGEGDALRIMATVMKMITQFIKMENPKYMHLSAAKDKNVKKTGLQGRERLYGRLVKKAVGNKYRVHSDTDSSGTIWYIKRKGAPGAW
jgi:hypothetical protein